MGVLLIHSRIEMGASVWEQFPQLQSLPEEALACFVTAQCLPNGLSKEDVAAWADKFHKLMLVYRQNRHAFHMLSANIQIVDSDADGCPSILMALSSDRWPTFREVRACCWLNTACRCLIVACAFLRAACRCLCAADVSRHQRGRPCCLRKRRNHAAAQQAHSNDQSLP
jgi:hypothetical protein